MGRRHPRTNRGAAIDVIGLWVKGCANDWVTRLDYCGLIIGVLAKLVMPGKDPGGIIATILIGIVGALLGGFLGRALGFYREGDAAGWMMSILGAIILLALYRMMVGRRAV